MSRIRVGPVQPAERAARPAPPGGSSSAAFLEGLPLSAVGLVLAGFCVAFLGLLGASSIDTLNPYVYVTRGIFLAPMGAGIVVLGLMKGRLAQPAHPSRAWDVDAATEKYIMTLKRMLVTADRANTVEHIAERTGWAEADVVRTLAWLRHRDEILEEMDLDTGHFYYVTAVPPRDLDTRLQQIGGH